MTDGVGRYLPFLGIWSALVTAGGAKLSLPAASGLAASILASYAVLAAVRWKRSWIQPHWLGGWKGWGRALLFWPPTVFALVGIGGLFGGSWRVQTASPGLDAYVDRWVRVEGEVESVLRREAGSASTIVRIWSLDGRTSRHSSVHGRVYMRLPVSSVSEGDAFGAVVRLRLPPPPPAPFPEGVADPWEVRGAEYRAECAEEGVWVRPRLQSAPYRLRAALERTWDERVGGQRASLLKAMVLGDTSYLDPAVADSFALVGVAHVVAVSGTHLHLVLWPLRRWVGPRLRPTVRAAVLVGMAGAYTALTGASPSAVRAAGMIAYLEAGALLGRPGRPLQAWGAVLAVESLVRPEWVFDVGFQLSYAAVWGLMVLEPVLKRSLSFLPSLLRTPAAGALAAEIAVCPFGFSRFYVWNAWSILANLWAPLLGAILLPAGFVSLFLSPVPVVADWSARAAGVLAQILIDGVAAMDADRRGAAQLGPVPIWGWVWYIGSVLGLVALGRKGYSAGWALVALFTGVCAVAASLVPERAVALAAGGATAYYVQSDGRRVLVCPGRPEAIDAAVAPYLRRMGVYRLDEVWVISGDGDPEGEAVLKALKRWFRVGEVSAWRGEESLVLPLGRTVVAIGGTVPGLAVPGLVTVDWPTGEPVPFLTGRERSWRVRGQGGLLIEVRAGVPRLYGGTGPVRSYLPPAAGRDCPGFEMFVTANRRQVFLAARGNFRNNDRQAGVPLGPVEQLQGLFPEFLGGQVVRAFEINRIHLVRPDKLGNFDRSQAGQRKPAQIALRENDVLPRSPFIPAKNLFGGDFPVAPETPFSVPDRGLARFVKLAEMDITVRFGRLCASFPSMPPRDRFRARCCAPNVGGCPG